MKYLLIALFTSAVLLTAANLDRVSDTSLVTALPDQEILIQHTQPLMRDSGSRHGTGNGRSADSPSLLAHRGRGHGTGNG